MSGGGIARFIGLLSFAAALAAQQREQPLGFVASVTGGVLTPANGHAPLPARAGDFLFSGDRIAARGGVVRFYWCPGGRAPQNFLYQLDGRAALTITAARPKLPNPIPAGECTLPAMERTPEVATLPAINEIERRASGGEPLETRIRALSPAERGPLAELLRGDLADPRLRLSLAARLEQARLPREAAAQYLQLAKAWQRQPRILKLAYDLAQAPATRALVQPPEPARTDREGGTIRALVVGISKYEQKEFPDLRFADRDAERFAAYLRTPRGGARDVVLLLNQKARVAAIRNHFVDVLSRTERQDTFVLFVAAHGDMQNGVPRVVTYRANRQEPAINSLPLTEIQKFMYGEKIPFRQARVFLDVCHSGQVALLQPPPAGRRSRAPAATPPEFFALTATHQGEGAYAYEDEIYDRGHGVFTYFLLRGLNTREAGEERILSAGTLSQYVFNRVMDATNRQQMPAMWVGTRPDAEIADLGKPGFPSFDSTPYERLRLPKERMVQQQGRREARKQGGPAPEPERGSSELDRRIALEDRGEAVLLRYLEGDVRRQDAKEFQECAQVFDSALSLQPGSPYLEARRDFCIGRASVFDKNWGVAMERLENSIRLDPSAAYAYNALGIAYLERAEYAQARLAFEDAIQRAPRWAYPRHNLALAYSEDGNFDLAVRTYQQAMRLAPDYFYLPYNLGLVLQRMNRPKEAEEQFRAAIAKAPDRAEPYTALAQAEAAQGRRGRAIERLRKAEGMLNQEPQAIQAARHNLGVLLASDQSTREEAIGLWKKNGEYPASQFALAETLESAGRDREAADIYRQILDKHRDHITARLKLAALLEKEGDREAAAADLKVALEVAPDSPVILEKLADVYARAGRIGEARETYDRAMKRTADRDAIKRIGKALRALDRRER